MIYFMPEGDCFFGCACVIVVLKELKMPDINTKKQVAHNEQRFDVRSEGAKKPTSRGKKGTG